MATSTGPSATLRFTVRVRWPRSMPRVSCRRRALRRPTSKRSELPARPQVHPPCRPRPPRALSSNHHGASDALRAKLHERDDVGGGGGHLRQCCTAGNRLVNPDITEPEDQSVLAVVNDERLRVVTVLLLRSRIGKQDFRGRAADVDPLTRLDLRIAYPDLDD